MPVKLVTVPSVVIRPIESLPLLVNHNAPSGPTVMSYGVEMPVPVNLVTCPSVVIRPIESLLALVNHSAPSGPATMPVGYSMPGPGKLEIAGSAPAAGAVTVVSTAANETASIRATATLIRGRVKTPRKGHS